MPKTTSRFVVPPFNGELFPHDSFPPYRSMLALFELVGTARARDPTGRAVLRMQSALLAASDRIIAIASGNLPVVRWHRRVSVAVRQLERARHALEPLVAMRLFTDSEGAFISDQLAQSVSFLVELVANLKLPDEIRAQLPELRDSLRVVH